MFKIFPYIFSTTLNAVSNNLGFIEDIVDNIIKIAINLSKGSE